MTTAVLCAVDITDTEHDRKVLKEAFRQADLDGARVDLITVVPDYGAAVVGSFFSPDHHRKMEERAHAALVEMVTEVAGAERNEGVRHIVATGKVYQEILHAAQEAGSDLIVIGSHKPDMKDYLLGPNAARVVRHSTASVYVVR